MISPARVAPVCSGDLLELTCSTPGSILEWAFATLYKRAVSRTNQVPAPLSIDSTWFTFSRLSAQNSFPLISTLSINPVNKGLNGTEVNCTDVGTSETVSTIITIIDENLIEGKDMK